MKALVSLWTLLATLSVFALARPGSGSAQENVTVHGEIVDLACYMAKGSRGPTHKACAQMCASKGVPIGVLTEEGEVFLLLSDDDNSSPYEAAKKLAGERAEVTGKKLRKGGLAGIAVGSVKLAASSEPERVAAVRVVR